LNVTTQGANRHPDCDRKSVAYHRVDRRRAEPAAAEIEAWQRNDTCLSAEEATPEEHPSLYNMTSGMLFGGVIRLIKPELPDYVAIEMGAPWL
jgi:hypothetical protein